MPKLSIIVPIYRVEQYLSRCIDSILAQTYTDYELILIDDGSPDRCGEIIDEYANRDSRVLALHQTNKGVSAARNTGLDVAKGEYIGFVDPDDWIDQTMYSKLITLAEDKDISVVCCNWDIYKENGECNIHKFPMELPQVMEAEELLCHLFDNPRSVGGAVWNKLFARSIINCRFNEKCIAAEDWLFITELCKQEFQSAYLNESVYHYYVRDASATNSDENFQKKINDTQKIILNLTRDISKKSYYLAQKEYIDTLHRRYNGRNTNCDNYDYLEARKSMIEYLRLHALEWIKNPFISWKLKLIYSKFLFNNIY